MFLQKTEEHYRFALNLEKKVSSDTEVTAKATAVGGKENVLHAQPTISYQASWL